VGGGKQEQKELEIQMKKFLLGTVAVVALGLSPAVAADMRMPVKAPAQVYAPLYNWTGLYLGLHAGYGFGNDSNLGIAGWSGNDGGGFLGGAQIGFDYQFAPNWVAGVEGQISWIDADRTWVAPGFALTRQADWLGSVTGRLGYTWGPGLLYVKGGAAWTNDDYTLLIGGVPGAFTGGGSNSTGWTLGAGLEYMFAPSWTAKLEYQYYDFGNTTLVGPAPFTTGVNVDNNIHTVKLGVNYRFNWAQ
jgi:outer membrane immunogenic protein